MDGAFKDLAKKLDDMPNGYPATESGVELRILAKLFTADEARLACSMQTEPLLPREISVRAGLEEASVKSMAKAMLGKGLIEVEKTASGIGFKLIPFVVGFYERQNGNIDAEFAELFERYEREGFHKIMSYAPSVHRVVPVDKSIPHGVEVMPYERASSYVETARAWAVLPCICRVQKRLAGKGCGHAEENCLVLSDKVGAFAKAPGFRVLSMEEALEVLSRADAEGLVHSTSNVRTGVSYICNCCACSCGVLRAYAEQGHRNAVARSDFRAEAIVGACSGCGLCIERCPFKATSLDDGAVSIDADRCYGCGLCASACPAAAIGMVLRPESERLLPPATEADWNRERAEGRKRAK